MLVVEQGGAQLVEEQHQVALDLQGHAGEAGVQQADQGPDHALEHQQLLTGLAEQHFVYLTEGGRGARCYEAMGIIVFLN